MPQPVEPTKTQAMETQAASNPAQPAASQPSAAENPTADPITIDISHIQTDDQTPVDSLFAEREQRLLVDSLYASWKPNQPFLACDNVGVFYGLYLPPVVPDMFVSLGVAPPQGAEVHEKRRRSYFIWEYGKAPDVVVEVLSPSYGGEFDEKMRLYERIGARYYVIHDPANFHSEQSLVCYELRGGEYARLSSGRLEKVGLEARLWVGKFDGVEGEWLRWYDASGSLLLTGGEAAEQERQRAEAERQRAEAERQRAEAERQRAEAAEAQAMQERQRAEQERQRAEQLAAALRKLGIDPDKL